MSRFPLNDSRVGGANHFDDPSNAIRIECDYFVTGVEIAGTHDFFFLVIVTQY